MISDKDLKKILKKARSEIKVVCDEAHAHETTPRCYVPIHRKGNHNSVTVAMLCEQFLAERAKIGEILNPPVSM